MRIWFCFVYFICSTFVAAKYGISERKLAIISKNLTTISKKSFYKQCPTGYTGENCENPICDQKYTILHHNGMSDYGETIDYKYSTECDDTYLLNIDEYVDTIYITIVGFDDSNPGGILYDPKSQEVLATLAERFDTSQILYTFKSLASDHGYGIYQFIIFSYNREGCFYEVKAPTSLVIDGGFITNQLNDNVQEIVPSDHNGVGRFPIIGYSSYFAFSMATAIQYPSEPKSVTIYEIYRSEEFVFTVKPRYHCNANAIAGPFTCDHTSLFYRIKISGFDSEGNLWQRIYPFNCDLSGTASSTPDPGPPSDCLNGGIMINGGTSNAVCYCGEYFEGRECEIKRCFNDGILGIDGRCMCQTGFTGTYCQHVACTSSSGTQFDISVRALTFIVRATTSMSSQKLAIVQAATQITNYYSSNHAGYFQKYVLVSLANGVLTSLNEYSSHNEFINGITTLEMQPDLTCEDTILVALSAALNTPTVAQYTYSPIFVFSDGLSNDDENERTTLLYQLTFWRGQVFFLLTDSINGVCKIDMADPGYRSLRSLAQFSHGLVIHVDVAYLSQTAFEIASTFYRTNYLLSNDLLYSCNEAPQFQTFFVDDSVHDFYIVATGFGLLAELKYPNSSIYQPELLYNANNTFIWHESTNIQIGSYLLTITSNSNGPCQYRVLGHSDHDLFIGISQSITKDAIIQQPTFNTESHIVAHINNVYLSLAQFIHAEAVIWTNEGINNKRTVIYASSGIYRDQCDYYLYFGSWKCSQINQFFYINVFLTNTLGFTVMRTSTGFCSPGPPTPVTPEGCQNGGIPFSNGTCICPAHYTGELCQNIVCLNLGTAVGSLCNCLAGFSGQHCETISCYVRNSDVTWSPHGRSLTLMIHDSISTRSTIKTIRENAARVLEISSVHNQDWLTSCQVVRFNNTNYEVVTTTNTTDECISGVNKIYDRNIQNSEISCSNIEFLSVLFYSLRHHHITSQGIFIVFINGYIKVDAQYMPYIYEYLELTKVHLYFVLLSGSPCGKSMTDNETMILMNLAQFSNGQFILAMPSNAGKVVHLLPTLYRGSYVYESFVSDCTRKQTFYFPVDSQTQAFTSYIVGDLDSEPVYYSASSDQTNFWKVEIPVNMWDDIAMGSRMDQIIQPCDNGWQMSDNRCFKFGINSEDWYTARDNCHAEGAVMATIYNLQEQAFIDLQVYGVSYWTGLNNILNKDIWVWDQISGNLTLETTGYTNWGNGQPQVNEQFRCVYDSHSSGRTGWTTASCTARYPYICLKHAYNSDFEPNIDGKTNILPRGIWKMEVQSYEGPCYIQIFSQSGIELYTEYTSAVHDDKGNREPFTFSVTNRIIAHTTNQQWAGQGIEGRLQYAHLYTSNLTIIQAQRFERRDESSCAYEHISTQFECPDDVFVMMTTGIDRYGYLYQRIQQVMCLMGPSSQEDCLNGAVFVKGLCICAPNYEGMFCEKPICQNGGQLSATQTMCICPSTFTGTFCRIPVCQRHGEIEMPSPYNRTFVLLIDGSQTDGMESVINDLPKVLNAVFAKTSEYSSWFTHYTGVVFRDTNVTSELDIVSQIYESDNASDFINKITAEAQKPYKSAQVSRAVVNALGTIAQSDMITPRSEFFVITTGDAEDYLKETKAMDAIGRKRAAVNFIIVGDEAPPANKSLLDPSVSTYRHIADMTGGNFYQAPGSSEGLQRFWVELMGTMFDSYYFSKVTRLNCSGLIEYIQVPSSKRDIIIDAYAQVQPLITLYDTEESIKNPYKNVSTNTNHIIGVTTSGEPGLWKIQIDQGIANGGFCIISVRGQSSADVYIGFTLDVGIDGGFHSDDVSLYPVVGENANAITATTNAGVLLFAQVFSTDERTLLWASPLIKRSECSWPYISQRLFTCPAASFVVAIDGEDFNGYPFRRMIHVPCIGNFIITTTGLGTTTTPTSISTASQPSTTSLPTCDPDVPIVDAVLVFDSSSGMPQDEFRKVIGTLHEIPEHVTIGPSNTRFIVGTYSDVAEFYAGNSFSNITDEGTFRTILTEISLTGYSGITGNNIISILESINQEEWRTEAQRLIIFFSSMGWDRGNNGQGFQDPTAMAKAFSRAGVGIIAIGYGPYANETQLSLVAPRCVKMVSTNAHLEASLPWIMSLFCSEDQSC